MTTFVARVLNCFFMKVSMPCVIPFKLVTRLAPITTMRIVRMDLTLRSVRASKEKWNISVMPIRLSERRIEHYLANYLIESLLSGV